jgi:hypothetical protein
MHRGHGEGVGIVAEVEEDSTAHLLDTQDADSAYRIAVFDTGVT